MSNARFPSFEEWEIQREREKGILVFLDKGKKFDECQHALTNLLYDWDIKVDSQVKNGEYRFLTAEVGKKGTLDPQTNAWKKNAATVCLKTVYANLHPNALFKDVRNLGYGLRHTEEQGFSEKRYHFENGLYSRYITKEEYDDPDYRWEEIAKGRDGGCVKGDHPHIKTTDEQKAPQPEKPADDPPPAAPQREPEAEEPIRRQKEIPEPAAQGDPSSDHARKCTDDAEPPRTKKQTQEVWIGVLALVFTCIGAIPGFVFAVWGYAKAKRAGHSRFNPNALWRLCVISFGFFPVSLLVWSSLLIGLIEGTL